MQTERYDNNVYNVEEDLQTLQVECRRALIEYDGINPLLRPSIPKNHGNFKHQTPTRI